MKYFKFAKILTQNGWLSDHYVRTDDRGKIVEVSSVRYDKVITQDVKGILIPGIPNAHSHAFQYAMAGMAESHDLQQDKDDFWSWRKQMYQLALTVSADDLENIACMAYAEMLRNGYTHVAEFHYIHHQANGDGYDNPAELGCRMIEAAKKTGIRITLIPVYYSTGGFGQPANPEQRRFICGSTNEYFELLDASRQAVETYDGASLGFGVHSLRAIREGDLSVILSDGPENISFHLHIAEQLKEVEDAQAFLGMRPVEWLDAHCDMNDRFHLVHATHLNQQEIHSITKSGANVILCPSTEGNLGDGIFGFDEFRKEKGKWSIGSDSQIGLYPMEEIRWLDYNQRLRSHSRNVMVTEETVTSGEYAFDQVITNGRKAMGITRSEYFTPGIPLDGVVYDLRQPLLATTSDQALLSTIVYHSDPSMIMGTMVNGEWLVYEGRHVDYENICGDFYHTVKKTGR